VKIEDKTELPIEVHGCSPALVAKVVGAEAVGVPSFSWDIQTKAAASALQLPLNTAGNNTYQVSFVRSSEILNPQLSVTLELQNLGSSPVAVAHFTYVINTTCESKAQTAVGSFTCNSGKQIQGFSKAKCSFPVPLQCAKGGTVALTLLTSAGRVVAAAPAGFKAPAAPAAAAAGDLTGDPNACVTVSRDAQCCFCCCCVWYLT
jgi:hypothetical protein